MFYSYVMGVDDDIFLLKKDGFVIAKDCYGNFTVAFDRQNAPKWEQFVVQRLPVGYWNEYLADGDVVFIFHLEDGFKRYVVKNYADGQVLQLCEELCQCKFTSLKNMLASNHYYHDKVG